MSELLEKTVLPETDGSQSLQSRLQDLRSKLQPGKGLDETKLRKACQDFEAVFIGQIWKQMRSSVPKDGMLHSKEEEGYVSMFDQELSVKMARSGGIGLSDMLYANLSERLVNASRDTSAAKPLMPLDMRAMSTMQAQARAAADKTSTLATITAQHEADMLARSIEMHRSSASNNGAVPSMATAVELDDALKMVRMDGEDGL